MPLTPEIRVPGPRASHRQHRAERDGPNRAQPALGGFIALDERLQVLLSNTLDRIDRAQLQPRPEHQGRQASQYDNRKPGKSNKIAGAG